jgi:hypothetical protein
MFRPICKSPVRLEAERTVQTDSRGRGDADTGVTSRNIVTQCIEDRDNLTLPYDTAKIYVARWFSNYVLQSKWDFTQATFSFLSITFRTESIPQRDF